MKKIVCISANPSFDVNLYTPTLSDDKVNRVSREESYAAGKALNVCKELMRLGKSSELVAILGKTNATRYIRACNRYGINCHHVDIAGGVRENLTIIVNGGQQTIKINRTGLCCIPPDIEAFGRLVRDTVSPSYMNFRSDMLSDDDEPISQYDDQPIAIFTGSLPKGMGTQLYCEIIESVKALGALVAVDSDALTFEQMLEIQPWLYKPNRHELTMLLKTNALLSQDDDTELTEQELVEAACRLCERGITNILLTLGKDGLVLVSDNGQTVTRQPASNKLLHNTVGAGDRTLAGFVSAYCDGLSLGQCTRMAVESGEYSF